MPMLSIEVAHVGFHGVGRDDELLGDLRCRAPFNEEAQHILFAAGEVVGAGGLGAEGFDIRLLRHLPGRPAASQRSRFSPVANALLRASWRLRASNDLGKRRPVRVAASSAAETIAAVLDA